MVFTTHMQKSTALRLRQLKSQGWAGVLVKGPDMPASSADRNRILAQEPPAGQHLDTDGEITLRFGA
jgi:eukaryotic-like serine/threonine-protein kinase